MKNPFVSAELALDDTATILMAAINNFPAGHQRRVEAIILALRDLEEEISGPRVRYVKYEGATAVEVITGRHLKARSTRCTIAILADDGLIHSRSTEGGSWELRRLEEDE